MKNLLLALLLLVPVAACGGGGEDPPDANPDDPPDAADDPADAEEADADLPDAEVPDAATCTTDPECVGAADGESRCVGNSVVSCAQDGDCLAATVTDCTNTDVCVDDGSPACQANGDGEACASVQVITADTTVSGADFGADFADDQDFTDDTCEEGDPDAANVEAVFAVNLNAGQSLLVTETGGIDVVMGIQTACGNAEACVVSVDDDPSEAIGYVAAQPETLYVYVSAYDAPPTPADYSIEFDIADCGDGVIDPIEECDDDNSASDDGCSSICVREFGFDCDDAEPTVCTAFPDLGSFGGGATITESSSDTLDADTSAVFTVTFTEPVRVIGTLTATTGDADWFAYASTGGLYAEDDIGNEIIGDGLERYFTAGTYLIEVYAVDELTDGFTLTMMTTAPAHTSLGSFAATDTITDLVQSSGLTAGTSDYYTITFTEDVLLSGSLDVTTTGDVDLYWWTDGNPMFTADLVGPETVTDEPLAAGTYHVRVNAYFDDPDVDGYTLSLSTTAAP